VDIDGVTVGLTVCYDLRFPELFRILALRGAEIFVVPAAFAMATGRDHWEVLLRARAIENTAYVVAPNQVGVHPPGRSCYGRSQIIDPWGVVIANAPDRPTVITATIDLAQLRDVRRQIPSLANRMPDSYAWPDAVSSGALAGASG
jgi:deaminated glutathione amidase